MKIISANMDILTVRCQKNEFYLDKEISVYYKVSIDTFRSQARVYREINRLQEATLVLRKHLCLITLFRILSAPAKLEYLCVTL